jgi:hypothetical protein
MIAKPWQRTIAVLCVVSFVLTACTSLQAVSVPSGETPPSLPDVKVGDKVVITTKAGQKKTFAVAAVEADALVGEGIRIAYADMATLGVKHIRKGATTAVALVVAFILLVAYDTSHVFDPD